MRNELLGNWVDREHRRLIAHIHTDLMDEKYAIEIEKSIRDTILYSPDVIDNSLKYAKEKHIPNIEIDDIDTVSAVLKFTSGKTAVLNFASYKNPGGMFIAGSRAQEECLCHESFLYNVLRRFRDTYYKKNSKNSNRSLYRDRALYTPNIIFMRNNREVYCDVINCASPNKGAAQDYHSVTDSENYKALESRIKFVLEIAQNQDVETLILGAFGCGVFKQDPKEVSDLFMRYLTTGMYTFKKVIFAIPKDNRKNYNIFRKTISNYLWVR